ncbi:MAG: alpha/beta fold hydrolase [Candidatus Binatus sp.]|jgi:homoserine O-acetyltransferase|uniref:homoserine O-acetyltransferase family protein n=1 Tax=Candidatus Binatus sp. TaxID=2811406 RepID=UPI003C75A328
MANQSGLGLVEVKSFSAMNFRLQSGEVLPELKLVYETYGTLAPDGRNAILATHGYTSSQHAAGLNANGEAGLWDGLIGPGKAIDTNKYFVVSSNMLGSSYGSTAPASINPKTGKPYGPDFPDYSVADIVTAQRALLDALGVKHLVAVAGPSFGGYQAFQWSVTFPDAMSGIVAAVTSPSAANGDRMVADLRARFAEAPGWNGGHHYGSAEMLGFMTELRVATLKRYGIEAELAARFPDPAKREAAIHQLAEPWARAFDPNSMIALARARSHYNAEKDFAKIRAKVLYVLSRTDKLFPPSIAPDVMAKLKAARVDATYFEIGSDKGHMASGADWQKWDRVLRDFLKGLE